jgi:general stress protein 26
MGGDERMTADQRELWERIDKVRPAMMTTVELDGSFRSRPMWTQGDEFDGTLWFFSL